MAERLEIHLKQRAGDLFDLEYDLLMYVSVAATTNANGDAAVSEQEQAPETFILCRSRDRSRK